MTSTQPESTPWPAMQELHQSLRKAYWLGFDVQRQVADFGESPCLPQHINAVCDAIIKANSMVRQAQEIESDLEKLINRLHTAIPLVPQDADAVAATKQKMDLIDGHLRGLERRVANIMKIQTTQLGEELNQNRNDMGDYEMEVKLSYVLANDDPAYAENDDNILTRRGNWAI